MSSVQEPEIVIIGGGVAGLAAAIGAARNDLTVFLLEKNSEFGRTIRGEVINRSDDIFKRIFKEFPNDIVNLIYKNARYHAPSTLKHADRPFPTNDKVSINYRGLINKLTKTAIKDGVKLELNTSVIDFVEKNDKIAGIKYMRFDEIGKMMPKSIICACGLNSNLKLPENLKAPTMVCPALKIVATNLKLPNPQQLEFFLLEFPGAIWIFPNSEETAELGVTIWVDYLENPEDHDLDRILAEKTKNHPILKDILADCTYLYYQKEKFPLGGPINETYLPNAWFIGDVMGQVGAVGGSGIISCLTLGYEVGDFLANRVKDKGELELEDFQECHHHVNKLPISKKLRKEKTTAKLMRDLLYGEKKDIKKIDELWDKFKMLIETRPP